MAEPGMAPEEMAGAPAPEGEAQSAGDQVAQLVQGIGESMSLLMSIIQQTPGAPEEAAGLLSNSLDTFKQSMQLMTGGATEDEAAAEPETSIEGMAELQNKPAFKPKTMGSL